MENIFGPMRFRLIQVSLYIAISVGTEWVIEHFTSFVIHLLSIKKNSMV
jgi:hypothetical protein